jgi:hypothetical protein
MKTFCRAQKRLGRDAAPVKADATQIVALDDRSFEAKLRRTDGGDIAAGASASSKSPAASCFLQSERKEFSSQQIWYGRIADAACVYKIPFLDRDLVERGARPNRSAMFLKPPSLF